MTELRTTLLILGALFIAALAWWERRRPRHAGGRPEAQRRAAPEAPADPGPRFEPEPPLILPPMRARDLPPSQELPVLEIGHERELAPG